MRRAPSPRVFLPANQAAACNVGQCCCLAVAQSNVDVLAPACPRPAEERRHDAVAGVQAGGEVRDGHADLDGWPVSLSRDVHQAELCLDHDVVSCPVSVRACLPVTCDGGVDQTGIDFTERLIVHVIFLERPREIVLDEDIAFCHKLVQNVYPFLMLKGQTKRLLVSVDLVHGVSVHSAAISAGAAGRTARK